MKLNEAGQISLCHTYNPIILVYLKGGDHISKGGDCPSGLSKDSGLEISDNIFAAHGQRVYRLHSHDEGWDEWIIEYPFDHFQDWRESTVQKIQRIPIEHIESYHVSAAFPVWYANSAPCSVKSGSDPSWSILIDPEKGPFCSRLHMTCKDVRNIPLEEFLSLAESFTGQLDNAGYIWHVEDKWRKAQ